MSTAIAAKKLSTRPVEPGDRQRARQSKRHHDCRSTKIKLTVTQISLALSSGRDNHPPAATAEKAILIVAVFPSRLSRYRLLRHVRKVPCPDSRRSTHSGRRGPLRARKIQMYRQRWRHPETISLAGYKFGVGFSLMAGQLELAAGAVRFSRLRTAPPRD